MSIPANNIKKNGATSLSRLIRNSKMYREWRLEVFKRDGYSCVLCGSSVTNLNIDHYPITFSDIIKKMLAEYGEENAYENSKNYSLFWDISNGRVLCEKCHFVDHHKMNRKGVMGKTTKGAEIFITLNGETRTISQWAKITGIHKDTIRHRFGIGMSPEHILYKGSMRGSLIMYNGENRTLPYWCNKFGLKLKPTWTRIFMDKWDVENAFFYPKRQKGVKTTLINKSYNSNRRTNKIVIHNGESKPVFEWAKLFKIDQRVLLKRLNRGWGMESAANTPVRNVKRRLSVNHCFCYPFEENTIIKYCAA
jgi:hypothetical protein